MLELKGKAAVVTGASSDDGIGSECAKILASRGCNVVVNYATNKAGGEKIAEACRAAGADAIAVQGDVSKNEDCERLVKACIDKWGRLDVLINNAATTKPIPHRRMDLLDAAEFQRIFSVNVIGTYQMTRAAASHLKASGDGAIVNISSVGAMRAGGSSIPTTTAATTSSSRATPGIRHGRGRPKNARRRTPMPGAAAGAAAWSTKTATRA